MLAKTRGGAKAATTRPGAKKTPSKKSEETKAAEAAPEDNDFALMETKLVVPADQIKLTAKQLDEDVTRSLTASDPNFPTNLVVYNFKEREYQPLPPGPYDSCVFHFSLDGSVVHAESDEGQAQLEWEKQKARDADEKRKAAAKAGDTEDASDSNGGKNQFNYSERAAQTYNASIKDRVVSTEPPEVQRFGATTTQWEVYDSYMAEYERTQRESRAAATPGAAGSSTSAAEVVAGGSGGAKKGPDVVHSAAMARSLKIMERMVSQNAEDEIYNDFKFWEDASDQFREGEGSLLPLWRFADNRTRRKQVTALAWNPRYPDLFAVAYGTYDFMKQGSGLVCVFSLKNASHPEYTFTTESGVMCLDFHPQLNALLAVGCYDGTVKVFDIRRKENTHIFMSDIKTGKHTDPVWQVRWQEDEVTKELTFFSISSDGRVASWTMSKNELKMEPVMTLKLVSSSAGKDAAALAVADKSGGAGSSGVEEEASLTGLAGGCCFDFNPVSEHLFLVGTEEGKIHKCSKAYSGQYLSTYEGHHMAVYAVKWNPFHPRVFLSCSADWTVKLWDHLVSVPIMSFDLASAVGDVAWAPYSSTVLAAVSSDGKVHVYDLHANKHEQLCEQKVVKRARLTHVAFNDSSPVLLVGDDRGGVNSLKLSPNLRRITPIPPVETAKGETPAPPLTRADVEIAKMDKLLAAADVRADPSLVEQARAAAATKTTASSTAVADAAAASAAATTTAAGGDDE